jgi:hypothetical protein
MRKLFVIGLERYQARYTFQLAQWTSTALDRLGVAHQFVDGQTLDNSEAIVTGQVLDAHGRSYYSLTQMAELVKLMRQGQINDEDVLFFEDMFTPGMESLPYIMNQIPSSMRPRIFVRCLAQTIDPDDFVHVWGMSDWMSLYEKMCDQFVDGILASNEEMVAHMKIAGWRAPIYNISGLSFGKSEVQSRVGGTAHIKSFDQREQRVSFASRFDQEKNPHFFMDLLERVKQQHPNVTFSLLAGGSLKSNDTSCVARARMLQARGLLEIHENLPKNTYYQLLNNTRVLFASSLQDWTSNVSSEADALGANLLFPAYRSFPEMFANDHTRLYVPWSLDDAQAKLMPLLNQAHARQGLLSDWTDQTIDRMVSIMKGDGEQWRRDSTNYRQHTVTAKY